MHASILAHLHQVYPRGLLVHELLLLLLDLTDAQRKLLEDEEKNKKKLKTSSSSSLSLTDPQKKQLQTIHDALYHLVLVQGTVLATPPARFERKVQSAKKVIEDSDGMIEQIRDKEWIKMLRLIPSTPNGIAEGDLHSQAAKLWPHSGWVAQCKRYLQDVCLIAECKNEFRAVAWRRQVLADDWILHAPSPPPPSSLPPAAVRRLYLDVVVPLDARERQRLLADALDEKKEKEEKRVVPLVAVQRKRRSRKKALAEAMTFEEKVKVQHEAEKKKLEGFWLKHKAERKAFWDEVRPVSSPSPPRERQALLKFVKNMVNKAQEKKKREGGFQGGAVFLALAREIKDGLQSSQPASYDLWSAFQLLAARFYQLKILEVLAPDVVKAKKARQKMFKRLKTK
jgi:hypothetical protein